MSLPPRRDAAPSRRIRGAGGKIRRRSGWEAGELVLEVLGRPCQDSMSGERFESEVVVTWKGQTLRGCGRALH